ncbi:MAG: oxidoreductase [Pseudomonadota bacterium]
MDISDQQKPIGSGYEPKTAAAKIAEGVDLSGKTAIITGGYSGIGLETTRAIARCGAKVIAPARSMDKAREALAGVDGDVTAAAMDLGDVASVRKFAADFKENREALDLLINNAGIMACPETRIGPGWEAQFATNHIGHFVLSNELAPALAKAGGARVVALSSVANKRSPVRFDDINFEKEPYDKWVAYAQSKTANSLFAVELDARLKDRGVRAFAVHPGGIMTPLQRHLDTEEMVQLGWMNPDGTQPPEVAAIFKTPEEGASTSVWCALSPQLDGIGGVYCEDLDVANVAGEDSVRWLGVAPWAVDREAAGRLWEVTEAMLAG